MAREDSPASSGWEHVIAGALLGLIGTGILLGAGTDDGVTSFIGLALVWLGGLFTLIGAVGVGVTIGVRRARDGATPRAR